MRSGLFISFTERSSDGLFFQQPAAAHGESGRELGGAAVEASPMRVYAAAFPESRLQPADAEVAAKRELWFGQPVRLHVELHITLLRAFVCVVCVCHQFTVLFE